MKLPASILQTLRPRYEGRAVTVTGGAGFIGGHLVDALHRLGACITVIDDLSGSDAKQISDLVDVDPDRVGFVHGSILDPAALADAVDGAATVFHLAAVVSVPRSVEDPQRTWDVNAAGTLRVLEAARAAGAGRVVLAGSSSAYGGGPLPALETLPPQPLSPYAASKVGAESLMQAWANSYELSTISLRYFNVFGPRQPSEGGYAAAIASFIGCMLQGEAPIVYGDGEQTRDFTPVANAVAATLLAGAKPEAFRGERVNIASGATHSLNVIIGWIAEAMGVDAPTPIFRPAREGDVRHSRADLTRASELLGYETVCSTRDGIQETVEWCRAALRAGAAS